MNSSEFPRVSSTHASDRLIDFARNILKRLRVSIKDEQLISDLEQQILLVRQQDRGLTSATSNIANSHGALVWNAALNLNSEYAIVNSKLVALLRVFAFVLIDHAQTPIYYSVEARLVVLTSANATMRDLLDNGMHLGPNDICEWIYSRAGEYEASLTKILTTLSEMDRIELQKRKSECQLLRISIAWKQSKLQIAYNLFAQLNLSQFENDFVGAEDAADLAFEIGRQIYKDDDIYQAVKWLELSYNYISYHEIADLSEEAPELRLHIITQLASALLRLPESKGIDRASGLVRELDGIHPEQTVISMLKIGLLAAKGDYDPVLYYEELSHLICCATITQDTFDILLGYSNILKAQRADLAVKALNELIDVLLKQPGERRDWLETAMASRIWVAMDQPDSHPKSRDHIVSAFDLTWDDSHTQMRADGATASLVLLWKQINLLMQQGKRREAIDWCNLGLHPVLALAGPQNIAKVHRKAMFCALELGDAILAQGYFDTMPPVGQRDLLSQYMLFRTAQMSGDNKAATKCLAMMQKLQSQGKQESQSRSANTSHAETQTGGKSIEA